MESLSYAFEGRPLLFSDDSDFQLDGLMRNKNLLKKWDGEDAVESMGFMEPLLPDMAKKTCLSDHCLESSIDDTGKSTRSASSITLNSLMEFRTKFSSFVNKSNDEPKESNGNRFPMDTSSPEQSVSVKKSRTSIFQSTVPTCQVFGCNKDLSSSKDYHKRHKVCDVHSKTPVVIVNGIQQRFCQQCSRFHELAEFDEGKRSCRKRLAGHNKRRRKPQFDTHLGSTYFTTDASKTSLFFSKILPTGFFGLQYNEPARHSQYLNLEEKPSQLLPKSVHFHGVGKQYPSKNCLNAPSSLPEVSAGSGSGFALSLLSARSQSLSSTSEAISMAGPLISKEYSATPFGENTTKNFTPVISSSSAVELERLPVISNNTGIAVGSDILPIAFCLERDTVDLLELSLHLQRVEEQRCYGEAKLENGIFCDSTIT